jgi:hypothetical protein
MYKLFVISPLVNHVIGDLIFFSFLYKASRVLHIRKQVVISLLINISKQSYPIDTNTTNQQKWNHYRINKFVYIDHPLRMK